MLWIINGIVKLKPVSSEKEQAQNTFSICIPLRNESESLPALFESLLRLDYPADLFEILLINDASEDDSEAQCLEFITKNPTFQIDLLQNDRSTTSPKKAALTKAIAFAKHEYILTIDADCVLPPALLQFLNTTIIQNKADCIAGPVIYKTHPTVLGNFQQLDLLSLQGATLGGFGNRHPFLCNGANFCYAKKAFKEVGGFQQNENIASGDDIFLLEKLQQKGFKTAYLANVAVAVSTPAPKSFSTLIAQRVRWAAKTSAYQNKLSKILGIVILLTNLIWVTFLFLAIFKLCSWLSFLLIFLVKFNLDFVVIYKTALFYEKQKVLKHYLFTAVTHPFFVIFVAVKSISSSYEWKGRTFKK